MCRRYLPWPVSAWLGGLGWSLREPERETEREREREFYGLAGRSSAWLYRLAADLGQAEESLIVDGGVGGWAS